MKQKKKHQIKKKLKIEYKWLKNMAIFRKDEIRKMSSEERQKNLNELSLRMLRFTARIASGGNVENPGEIKEIKRTIARIKTIENEKAREKMLEELQTSL